jgi:cyclophilin family peptidyl-prolyl cis-trans isomerase
MAGRPRRRLLLEVLEGRQLLSASLAPIPNVTVPAFLGYQVTLDGTGTTDPQSFAATSSNPDIKVSVGSGPFWTLTVNHTPNSTSDVTITNETMTFQLFNDLTQNTVSRIETLTNHGFFTTTGYPGTTTNGVSTPNQPGNFIPRITSVANSGFAAIQGGSTAANTTSSSSGLTPTLATEISPGLAFTGTNQLAMANTGAPNSSDAQFFITNGPPPSTSIQQAFDFNYTVFGQLVSGLQTVTDLSKVATGGSAGTTPLSPVTITGATLSTQNPSGVLHVDATNAKAGETATITVTATDLTDHTTAPPQTFTVTVGAYNGPTTSAISASTSANTPTTIQLTKNPQPTITDFTFTYKLMGQPANGTATLNPTTGSVVYTPNRGFAGNDSFQYQVLATSPTSTTPTPISLGTVNIAVAATPIVPTANTGAVRVIGPVLVVDPVPTGVHATNFIVLNQVPDPAGGNVIQVAVNGILDSTQPSTSAVSQIVVFGNKSSDNITVEPSVTLPATLDGGHGGGRNLLRAGAGPTLMNAWWGHTTLVGGSGPNEMVGRKGLVRFKPSSTTGLMYVGNANPALSARHPTPAGGAYYRFVKGHLVRVK